MPYFTLELLFKLPKKKKQQITFVPNATLASNATVTIALFVIFSSAVCNFPYDDNDFGL